MSRTRDRERENLALYSILLIILNQPDRYHLYRQQDKHQPQWHIHVVFVCVVSGLSSSKVLMCTMLIKDFCRGQAGWNDRAICIETDHEPASDQSAAARLAFSNLWQSNAKHFVLCPLRNPNEPSILRNLPITTTLSLVCGPF